MQLPVGADVIARPASERAETGVRPGNDGMSGHPRPDPS